MDARMEALCRTSDRLHPSSVSSIDMIIASKCLDDSSFHSSFASPLKQPFFEQQDKHIGVPPPLISSASSSCSSSPSPSPSLPLSPRHPDDGDVAMTNNNIQLALNTLTTLEQNDQPRELTLCIKNVKNVLSVQMNHREIPEEFISEMIHYLTLFYNVLQQGVRTTKPAQYYEQPRIYRQLEYFACILWRMMTCACSVYLQQKMTKMILEEPMIESLDAEANSFWFTATTTSTTTNMMMRHNPYFVDCDHFVDCLKTYLVNSGSFVKLDESLRQELMYYLDPGDCGVVTIFKFMPFANFFRPFVDCVSNMHKLRNCSWFRGYLSKEEAGQVLVLRERGTFLLHFSGHYPDRLTLSNVPFELKGAHIDNIDRYSPLLLSVDGIRQRWFKQAQIPYEVDFSWSGAFFGLMSFEEAEDLLSSQPIGTYLLRLSHSSPGWFVVAYVSQNRKVLQLKVAALHQGFESGKRQFATLHQLVSSYSSVLKSVSFLSKFQQDTRMVADRVKRIMNTRIDSKSI